MATKEHRRQAQGLLAGLESRVHAGPPIDAGEIHSAREFLRQNAFSPDSDYFTRLHQIQARLVTRTPPPMNGGGKRNYGGEAAGQWMQLQSAYDHVILSTCYEGDFNLRHGRVKISHRFNREGRFDFVELKFLRSLQPTLNGEIRKLLLVRNYQTLRKDWLETEAFALEILPRELIFLFQDIFHCPRSDVLAWLVNIGHRIAGDLLGHLKVGPANGHSRPSSPNPNPDQLPLSAISKDALTLPILQQAATLESIVEPQDTKNVIVRYLHRESPSAN